MTLEPEIMFAMIPRVRKEDFHILHPGETIHIPVRLEIEGDPLKTHTKSGWVALMEITKFESTLPPEALKRKYHIQGEMSYITGGKEYLAIRDILRDVFNLNGEYQIEVHYSNFHNTFLAPNEGTSYLVPVSVHNAWTGKLSEKTAITIQK